MHYRARQAAAGRRHSSHHDHLALLLCFKNLELWNSRGGACNPSCTRGHAGSGCAAEAHPHCNMLCAPKRRAVQSAAEAGRSGGSVRQALSGALQSEVAEYYRLLAVLEAMLANPIPSPGMCTTVCGGVPCHGGAVSVWCRVGWSCWALPCTELLGLVLNRAVGPCPEQSCWALP